MKKVLCLLVIIAVAALFFTGCGEKAGGTTDTEITGTDAGGGTTGTTQSGTSESGSGGSTGSTVTSVAVFTAGSQSGIMLTLTFYSDGTWTCHAAGTENGRTQNLDVKKGTYTGSPSSDGTLTLITTHQVDDSSLPAGVTLTNENAPLVAIPSDRQTSISATISGNTLTAGRLGEFTRAGASGGNSGASPVTVELPASVGTDPFRGNTYQSGSTKYVFKTDGTYEFWRIIDGPSSSGEWELVQEYEYTYNANTKIMSYKINRVRGYDGSSMWTHAESLAFVNELPDNSELFQQTGMTRAQMYDYINAMFNVIYYEKCEEETYQGNLCYSRRDYYPQNTSLNECGNSMSFSTSGLQINIYPSTVAFVQGYGSISVGSITFNYDITAITASTITARNRQNSDDIITLNYTKSWSDGVVTIVVTGADSNSQTALGNQSCTLSTSSSRSYYTKLNASGLPASVGTDPFRGNTYQTDFTKYVFKTDGSCECWYITDGPSGSGEWELRQEYEYTYNANTKIMSYKYKKMESYDQSTLWTLAEYLAWINELADNSEVFQQIGMTRTQMCDFINAWFNMIVYEKCEEESYQGNLCWSRRDYYPQDTSLNEYESGMFFPTSDLSIDIYSSGEALSKERYGRVCIGSTRYDITAITSYSITARIENGSETITLVYSKSWSDGVVTIVVTGADSASQTALGNQSCTLSTSTEKSYYQKQ